ncbi:MAG: hypothetical protein QOI95_1334 [Acidimicrobiaceae bacterium]|jgi:hypothetical protein
MHHTTHPIRRRIASAAFAILATVGTLGLTAGTAHADVVTNTGQTASSHVRCDTTSHRLTVTPWMFPYSSNGAWQATYASVYVQSYATGAGSWTTWFRTDFVGSNSVTLTRPSGAYRVYVQYLWYVTPTTYVIGGEWITSYQSPYLTYPSTYCSV